MSNAQFTKPTYIDLFFGCSGFSIGMDKAGFRCLAAIDINTCAINTFRDNLPYVSNILNRDISSFSPRQLDELLMGKRVDIIVGGPPCQGFRQALRF